MKFYGKFRLEITNEETGDYFDSGFNNNVILNKFFNLSGSASQYFGYCSVVFGSGSNIPLITDTNLQSPISNSDIPAKDGGIDGRSRDGNTFKFEKTLSFEGSKGKVQGNISELGLSYNRDDYYLFTRALVKDSQGNPTTISLGANDIVKLTYKIGYTVDLTTSLLDTQTIDVGGVQTTVELHAAGYNKTGNTTYNFWEPMAPVKAGFSLFWAGLNSYESAGYTQILQGDIADAGNFTFTPGTTLIKSGTYTPISFDADGTYINTNLADLPFGAGEATGTWNILVFSFDYRDADNPNYYPAWYLKFTPAIDKLAGQEVNISGLKIRCGRT